MIPPPNLTQQAQFEGLIASVNAGTIDLAGIQLLSSISKARPLEELDSEDEQQVSPTKKFWSDGKKFSKLFNGLDLLLQKSTQSIEMREAQLVLLHNLVQYQFPCFSSTEAEVFALLFKLREDPSRSVRSQLSLSCQLLTDSWYMNHTVDCSGRWNFCCFLRTDRTSLRSRFSSYLSRSLPSLSAYRFFTFVRFWVTTCW